MFSQEWLVASSRIIVGGVFVCPDLCLSVHSLNRYFLSSHHAPVPPRRLGIQQEAGLTMVLAAYMALNILMGDVEHFPQESVILLAVRSVVGK